MQAHEIDDLSRPREHAFLPFTVGLKGIVAIPNSHGSYTMFRDVRGTRQPLMMLDGREYVSENGDVIYPFTDIRQSFDLDLTRSEHSTYRDLSLLGYHPARFEWDSVLHP